MRTSYLQSHKHLEIESVGDDHSLELSASLSTPLTRRARSRPIVIWTAFVCLDLLRALTFLCKDFVKGSNQAAVAEADCLGNPEIADSGSSRPREMHAIRTDSYKGAKERR